MMIMAKAVFYSVDNDTTEKMLNLLVYNGKGGLSLVDNHGNNAVMHAAGSSNISVFRWFYQRRYQLADAGFDWNHRNNAKRNMLAMVRHVGANNHIITWCEDLAARRRPPP